MQLRSDTDPIRDQIFAQVAKADVVIMSGNLLAVALYFRLGETDAPIVLAKGRALTAPVIKEAAITARVYIYEDRDVAELLYPVADVGFYIPKSTYQPVARILADVCKRTGNEFLY